MIFYWIIFLLIALVAIYSKDKKKAFFIIAIILMLMGIMRARTVGNDLNGGYWMEYTIMGPKPEQWGLWMPQFEKGFSWLMAKFKFSISSDPLIFFHLLFFVTFFNYGLFLYRQSKYSALSLVFMFAFAYYFQLYNGMRQEFCYSIILVALSYFVLGKQKYLYFILTTIIVSFLFHKSMLLMLILPIIYKYYKFISHKLMIILLIVSSIASLALARYASEQMALLAVYLDDGSSNFSNYMQDTDSLGNYSQISNILNTIFCIYVVYTHRFRKDFFLTCYVFGVLFLNVFTPINWIFQRLAFPFMFYRVITYADLWYSISSRRERFIFRIAVIALSAVMFQNRLIADDYKDVVPYVNCLFQ